MAVLSVVRHHGRLADVEIPVQSFRNGHFREWAVDRAGGQTHDDMLELADAAVANQFAGEAEIAVAALLAADLNDALVVAHRFHEAFAFVNGERERFLGVDILAGLDRKQVHERVPVVGRAGDDDVNVIALHELAKVLVLLRHLPVLRELLGRGLGMAVVHVADREHVSEVGGAAAVAAALSAATDQGDAGTVIRTERLRAARPGLRSSSRNHPGTPVAAVMAAVVLRKRRRLI